MKNLLMEDIDQYDVTIVLCQLLVYDQKVEGQRIM